MLGYMNTNSGPGLDDILARWGLPGAPGGTQSPGGGLGLAPATGSYGLQSNGTVRLHDGTSWDPNDPLPSDYGGMSQQMGSTQPATPAFGRVPSSPAATPSPTPQTPNRMFGRGISSSQLQSAPLGLPDVNSAPSSLPTPTMDLPTPHVKLHFFDKGGLGSKIEVARFVCTASRAS